MLFPWTTSKKQWHWWKKALKKSARHLADIDRPELLVCCLSDKDPAAAMAEGKKLVAYYLATEPHIMKASGVSEELLEKVQAIMSWPATEEDYIKRFESNSG